MNSQATRATDFHTGSKTGFTVAVGAIALLAFILRVMYSSRAIVSTPISGDATQYVAYALNLLHQGIFSNAIPGSGVAVVGDAYRGPGYPALLCVALWLGEASGNWYPLVLKLQAAMGAATAVIAILIGRRFLSAPLALLAGLAIALWPHLITISGYLLSETLFGFLLALALWGSCIAVDDRRSSRQVAAGIASGAACLVNPIYLLFPWVVAALVARHNGRRGALVFLAAAMAMPAAWAIRNAQLEAPINAPPSRLVQNFVQGSWPLYHAAYMSRDVDPEPRRILAKIDAEQSLLARDPAAGLSAIGQRLSGRPLDYLEWYAIDKVYLLWDWDIRIGQGDIYIIHTENSPFQTSAVWGKNESVLRALNPLFFWAALAFSIACLLRVGRSRTAGNAEACSLLLALFFLYVTAVHAVLQAEPRHSIPYRSVELLLAMGFVGAVVARFRNAALSSDLPGQSPSRP